MLRSLSINSSFTVRELQALQPILVKTLLKADESGKRVRSLLLALGELSELGQDSLPGYWDEISRGTLAEGSELRFRVIKSELQCMACFMRYHPMDGKIHCPYCGSYGAKILSGEEFYLEAVELDEG